MAYALLINGVATEIVSDTVASGDVHFSRVTMLMWSDGQRAARGIYPIVEDSPVPLGKRVASSSLSVSGNVITRVDVLENMPLADRKVAMQNAADDIWADKTYAGFTYNFGGDIGSRTLQTRLEDQARWLALKDACNDAIMAGLGAQNSPIQLRPVDNINVTVTFNQIAACLRAMRTEQAGLLGFSWYLKDTISAAADHAALDAIDITANWPI